MADELTVDVWSDVVCPWCAIGGTQFLEAVEQLKGDIDVEVRFMPFELNPDMPAEGADQVALLAKAYGKPEAEVLEMRAKIEQAGEAAGFPMVYTGEGEEPPQIVWNTHAAHMLLRWALTVGGSDAQVRLKMALLRAHFQQRRNTADQEVLLDLAQAEGLDREAAAAALADPALSTAVKMEEQRGLQNNIRSVPTFVVNGKYILQGAAQPQEYMSALTKLASMEAMA